MNAITQTRREMMNAWRCGQYTTPEDLDRLIDTVAVFILQEPDLQLFRLARGGASPAEIRSNTGITETNSVILKQIDNAFKRVRDGLGIFTIRDEDKQNVLRDSKPLKDRLVQTRLHQNFYKTRRVRRTTALPERTSTHSTDHRGLLPVTTLITDGDTRKRWLFDESPDDRNTGRPKSRAPIHSRPPKKTILKQLKDPENKPKAKAPQNKAETKKEKAVPPVKKAEKPAPAKKRKAARKTRKPRSLPTDPNALKQVVLGATFNHQAGKTNRKPKSWTYNPARDELAFAQIIIKPSLPNRDNIIVAVRGETTLTEDEIEQLRENLKSQIPPMMIDKAIASIKRQATTEAKAKPALIQPKPAI